MYKRQVVNWDSLTRHVFSASSCGLCGKTSIESVFQQFPAVKGGWQVLPKLIASLPDKLRAAQETFSKTGGLHASGLFDLEGNLVWVLIVGGILMVLPGFLLQKRMIALTLSLIHI